MGHTRGGRQVVVSQHNHVSNFDFIPPLSTRQFAFMPLPELQQRPTPPRHLYAIESDQEGVSRISFSHRKYELQGEDMELFAKQLLAYLGSEAISLTLSSHYIR